MRINVYLQAVQPKTNGSGEGLRGARSRCLPSKSRDHSLHVAQHWATPTIKS